MHASFLSDLRARWRLGVFYPLTVGSPFCSTTFAPASSVFPARASRSATLRRYSIDGRKDLCTLCCKHQGGCAEHLPSFKLTFHDPTFLVSPKGRDFSALDLVLGIDHEHLSSIANGCSGDNEDAFQAMADYLGFYELIHLQWWTVVVCSQIGVIDLSDHEQLA